MCTSVSSECLTPSNIKRKKVFVLDFNFWNHSCCCLFFFAFQNDTFNAVLLCTYLNEPSKSCFDFSSQQNAHLPSNLCWYLGRALSWTCWARGSDSHVLCTSLLVYKPDAPSLWYNERRLYFHLLLRAQKRTSTLLNRNYRRKVNAFEPERIL